MKKYVLFALSAVAFASVQAATVDWSSGDLSTIATSEIKDVTAYYYVLDKDAYDQLSVMDMDDLVDNYVNANGTMKSSADHTKAMDAYGAADWSQTTDLPAYVAVVYMFKSAFGGSYAVAGTASYNSSEGTLPGYDDPLNDFSGEIGTTASANWAAGGGNGAKWVDVPEPTTVALLAIGLAAVGLKRKVA